MQETEHKSFGQPDETREFPHGKAEILAVGDSQIGRMIFNPGWRWSNDVKPPAVVVDWYGASNYAQSG